MVSTPSGSAPAPASARDVRPAGPRGPGPADRGDPRRGR